jgi:dTMP kinase
MQRGKLITIEGLDGAGKTTLALALVDVLREKGLEAELLREPGGVRAAEAIRTVVQDPGLEISARAEALLYAAARAQLVEEALAPMIERGVYVLLDRFVDSSLAYQGGGRELGIEQVRQINRFATGGLAADLTLLLEVDPAVGRGRMVERASPLDRLEREPGAFFAAVADAYQELARTEPERIRTIDASQPPDVVLAQASEAIAELL